MIDLEHIEEARLPMEMAVSALTMAELAAGPYATENATDKARRQDGLQRAEAVFEPLPFDADAARAYGRVYAAALAAGHVYTRNPEDFEGLSEVITIVAV